ncbi:hypothetical protein BT96DRAFT_228671 [Gymnopus androsaceus JB14]|uniref:G-protein coupled receptors family 1 profile domain-containing protein n=1 Tax=Gymnopus androsaceus JB14 TaxID=1447944 RepID=A0A6A4H620_9AGAR|nr:hypothetical protein BT96DRAFT_228671 [Gymnopus androsaceus JB14]
MYRYTFRSDESSSAVPEADSTLTEYKHLFTLFIVLQLFSLVSMIIILLTASVSSLVKKRHLSWSNFTATWIFSCISYSLLVGAPITWQPKYALCLTQAALVYTVPTLTACSTLALVIQILITVCSFATTSPKNAGSASHRLSTFVLFVFPYLCGGGMFVLSLTIGLKDRSVVARAPGGFYCNMTNTLPGRLSAVIVTVIMIICIYLDVYICVILRRHWHIVSGNLQASLATVMRVLVFSAVSVVAVMLGLVFFFMPLSKHGPGLELVLSLLSFGVVLVFGTQKDLVQSWNTGFQACFHSIQTGCQMLISLQRQPRRHGMRPYSISSQESMITQTSVNITLA